MTDWVLTHNPKRQEVDLLCLQWGGIAHLGRNQHNLTGGSVNFFPFNCRNHKQTSAVKVDLYNPSLALETSILEPLGSIDTASIENAYFSMYADPRSDWSFKSLKAQCCCMEIVWKTLVASTILASSKKSTSRIYNCFWKAYVW